MAIKVAIESTQNRRTWWKEHLEDKLEQAAASRARPSTEVDRWSGIPPNDTYARYVTMPPIPHGQWYHQPKVKREIWTGNKGNPSEVRHRHMDPRAIDDRY